MILCGFYSRMVWFIHPTISYTMLIIISWNQFWRYSFVHDSILIKIYSHESCFSALMATKSSIFRYQKHCWKILLQSLSKMVCFIMFIYHIWYRLNIKLHFLMVDFYHWCKDGPWYNATVFHNLHGPLFKYLFVTACQYIYNLMCNLNTYDKLHFFWLSENLRWKKPSREVILYMVKYVKPK